MKYSVDSKKGNHPINEDRIEVRQMAPDRLIAVVTDGMGGLDHGEIAAEICASQVITHLSELEAIGETDLVTALKSADDAIAIESSQQGMKMGCAVAVALIEGSNLTYASIGNIRLSYSSGERTHILAHENPYTDTAGGTYLRNCLTGRGFRVSPAVEVVSLGKDWHVQICTDGFYNNDNNDDASVIDIWA